MDSPSPVGALALCRVIRKRIRGLITVSNRALDACQAVPLMASNLRERIIAAGVDAFNAVRRGRGITAITAASKDDKALALAAASEALMAFGEHRYFEANPHLRAALVEFVAQLTPRETPDGDDGQDHSTTANNRFSCCG